MRRVKYTTIISYTVDPPPLRISSVLHLLTLITAQIPGNPWSVSCFCSFTFPRISHVLIGHLYIFFVEVSAQILCPFKNCLVSFLAVGFLYIFLAQVFFQICDLQIFSLSLGLSFHSLTVSFTEQLEKKFYKASVFHQFSISLHFNCLSPLNSRVLHLSRTQEPQMVPMTTMKNAFGQRISLPCSTPISMNSAQGPHHIALLTVPQTGQESFCLRAFALIVLSSWDCLPQISSWVMSLLPIHVSQMSPSHWGLLSRNLETITALAAANQEPFQSISSTHSGVPGSDEQLRTCREMVGLRRHYVLFSHLRRKH